MSSSFTKLCLTFCDFLDGRPQAPLSMKFSSQECWSGLPFPFPGDLPNPGIELTFPALAGRFFTTELPGLPKYRSNILPIASINK